MKKILILLLVMVLGGMTVQAQETNEKTQEVVKLKNGHSVRGKIVVYAPLDSLVIQEDDGTLQTIYWDRIKQITKEKWQPQQTMGSDFTPGKGPLKGYRGFFDLEFYKYIDANSENHFGFSTVHGYQFKPWFFAGAGAGMKISHKKHCKGTSYPYLKDIYMFPVFADVRFDLLKSRFSPYLDCRVGYTLGDRAFGVMFNPSIGCRMGLNDRLAINASLGYSTQSTDLVVYSEHNSAIWHHGDGNWQNNPYHCLSIKLGIEF